MHFDFRLMHQEHTVTAGCWRGALGNFPPSRLSLTIRIPVRFLPFIGDCTLDLCIDMATDKLISAPVADLSHVFEKFDSLGNIVSKHGRSLLVANSRLALIHIIAGLTYLEKSS